MVLYLSALTSFWAEFQYGEVSEGFKELVLKTSDSQEPWVRIPLSPPLFLSTIESSIRRLTAMQKYPSGYKGLPC